MNKSTKKNNSYNALVVNKLSSKFGYSAYYVRKCLRPDSKWEMADAIKKDYQRLVKQVDNALNQ
ncbi:MAG: hypothetical protein Q4G08_10570 [Capnocytophaga sp.]|nr:hypothetical protein [Capnocytophaga sp.]